MNLKPGTDWRSGITRAVGELLGEKNLEERLREIREKIKRMDMRWDNGFITDEDEYVRLRLALQQEMEQLTPVPDDDLQRAADLLRRFPQEWKALEGDDEARHQLVEQIVERVYAKDDEVVAMTLHSNFHLVLGHKMNEPTDFSIGSTCVAGPTGLEPAISGLTGQYVSRLHHGPTLATDTIIHRPWLSSNIAAKIAAPGRAAQVICSPKSAMLYSP